MVEEIFDVLYKKALQGSCMYRKYASAIVKNERIISVGYASTLNGEKCVNCPRLEKMQKHGEVSEFFESCRVVHAEVSAILNCDTFSLSGASIYLLGISENGEIYQNAYPCENCLKIIQYVGISKIFVFKERERVVCTEVKI